MGAAKIRAARLARVEREMFDAMGVVDRAWFDAHPDRSTYIRPALPVEIEFHHLTLGWPVCPGSGAIPGEGYACHVWEDFDRQRGGAMLELEADIRGELSADGRTVH